MKRTIRGRGISKGSGKGVALVSRSPVLFYGVIDPEAGRVIERGHELEGECVKGKVFIFPCGKGSTVGSWTLLALAERKTAPAAIINVEAEPVIAIGAIIANIPLVDRPDANLFKMNHTGHYVEVNADVGLIEVTSTEC